MAETPSTMIPLGTKAPDFRLLDTHSNQFVTLNELKSPVATVIMFLCNHCPYVKHIEDKLLLVARQYIAVGVKFAAISSNDAEIYPQDGPAAMRQLAEQKQFPFPYLYDETQTVAKQYQAACTPDFFVFDRTLSCLYRGRFDGSTPGNHVPVTGSDLCKALDAILEDKGVYADQKPSLGCNIKWKKRESLAL